MTTVNVNEDKYSVTVTEGVTTVVTVKAPGPQGIQGATGAGISAGDKGALTVAANLTDWTLNDSVVTNAKVSASAAIAGTKINPFFTSNITISNSHPQIFLTDTDNNSDFKIQNLNGVFGVRDETNSATRFSIASDGTATLTNNLIVSGDLTVSGTTTTINTQTLDVEDINVTLGKVGSPTDITADGGGITLLGDTNHTFNWLNATDSWTSSEHIALPDNKKLQLGDSQDLKIFHDGTQSIIQDNGTGGLRLRGENTISLASANGNEVYARFIKDGSSELYHNNVKRIETSADGVNLPDNSKLQLGDSQDLQIFHDSTDSFIENITGNLHIRPKAGEEGIKLFPDGSVYLYYNNEIKLTTASWGVSIWGVLQANNLEASNGYVWVKHDNQPVKIGVGGDLSLLHDGTDSKITNITGNLLIEPKSGETGIKVIPDGAVELYHNNVKKFETTSTGITATENVKISNDTGKLTIGVDDDLHIHRTSGNHSILHTEQGNLSLSTNSGKVQLSKATGDGTSNYEKMLEANANGSVDLYYDNVKRFGTATNGAACFGRLTMHGDIVAADNQAIKLGTGLDLTLFHDGTDSKIINKTGNLLIEAKDSETGIKVIPDDAVELYFDGSRKLSTRSYGCVAHGTLQANTNLKVNSYTGKLLVGVSGEFSIQHNNTDLFIENTVGNLHIRPKTGEEGIKLIPDGAVELYHNNVKKAETVSYGFDVSGKLEVLHPNTNTFSEIKCSGGISGLRISGSAAASAAFLTFANNHTNTLTDRWTFGTANVGASSDMVVYLGSGVTGTERLRIKDDSARVDFSCDIRPEADNTRALGSSSKRFSTLHSAALNTGDINMSNLNDSGNEVDGSKGSWTLQEGADDLFIINRVSGKKYKFNLTEIS